MTLDFDRNLLDPLVPENCNSIVQRYQALGNWERTSFQNSWPHVLPARARPLVWSYRPTMFCDIRFSNYQKNHQLCNSTLHIELYIYISDSIYIEYTVIIYWHLWFIIHQIYTFLFILYRLYIYPEHSIPVTRISSQGTCQPQTWKRARPGRPVLEIRLTVRNGQGLSFIVMDIMGWTLAI